jgi:hypothetical protein
MNKYLKALLTSVVMAASYISAAVAVAIIADVPLKVPLIVAACASVGHIATYLVRTGIIDPFDIPPSPPIAGKDTTK